MLSSWSAIARRRRAPCVRSIAGNPEARPGSVPAPGPHIAEPHFSVGPGLDAEVGTPLHLPNAVPGDHIVTIIDITDRCSHSRTVR